MIKLTNLINNSSFEKFNYKISDNTYFVEINNHTINAKTQITDKYAYDGCYSIRINDNNNAIISVDKFINSHKYYFRSYFKSFTDSTISKNVQIHVINKSNNTIYETIDYSINNIDWDFKSYTINSSTTNCDSIKLNVSANNEILIDALMLLDLTELFGENNEPSKSWCDKNIPYFEDSYELIPNVNVISFLNKSDFIYEKKLKKYFSMSYQPKIQFKIDLVDKEYNEDLNNDKKITVNVDITSKVSSDTVINSQIVKYYKDLKKLEDNVFICDDILYDENVLYAKYTVMSDNSLNNRVVDSFTIYFTKCFKELSVELEYNIDYASQYLRRLQGITNAYADVPMQITVFINGVKTSHVNILNKDDKLTVFEKDLYLSDGNNVIEVIATDICGNSYSKTFESYVDCMPASPDKEQLLDNFIGNDDKYVSLHLGDADVEYKTKDAGLNKDVIIDTSIDSHYFTLTGQKSKLYRISKDDIPNMESHIIKRPLAITFDSVEKIYDGTNDMTQEFRNFSINNGINVNDVHMEYNEFSNAGLVKTISERRITSDTICKQYETINDFYIIDKPNVNYNTFYINIDGYDGYSFLNENDGTAEIIFNNEKVKEYFESIILFTQNNITVLQFNYKDKEKLYSVVDKVNIKYNYSIMTESNEVVYKYSDEDSIKIDFSSATITSPYVTDEKQMINFSNIHFLGESANNYQLANYSASGKIIKRKIYPYINCLDKIYDGSVITPIEMNTSRGINGFDGLIEGDDVFLDIFYNDDRLDECHIFKNHGHTVFAFENPDVGDNKISEVKNIQLEGLDIHNYKLGEVSADFKASILPRPINIVINKVRFIRSKRLWEVDYTIINDIKTDNLTLNYNTNDEFDIQVFGGIDSNDNSMHLNYSIIPNIQTLFFDYDFNNNYNFNNTIVNGTHVENTDTYFWNNDDRIAEPDTERIDITANYDVNYEGNTKLSLTENPYFESQNKEYRIYNGCKVMVTNIHLNPSNDKNKNYTLLNNTYETTIEII